MGYVSVASCSGLLVMVSAMLLLGWFEWGSRCCSKITASSGARHSGSGSGSASLRQHSNKEDSFTSDGSSGNNGIGANSNSWSTPQHKPLDFLVVQLSPHSLGLRA